MTNEQRKNLLVVVANHPLIDSFCCHPDGYFMYMPDRNIIDPETGLVYVAAYDSEDRVIKRRRAITKIVEQLDQDLFDAASKVIFSIAPQFGEC